ncbi:flagellar basal body P-ring formation protein FlgA [Exilibacterium tricleocarpae]|uniref:Flagella basal body P-ring formation protein FlgA n=1 Tax=Exilibacterium tricleocarpae TaxID=2591008 RepID=A0A545U3R3_9GAMM|nr:flagellar basal body P-ring formation chaperone FlgA [Exilibacterium tricleocarpae]TQV84127.1 flagellar basal body P-ring formation protein FlgA [Exilibacterium tricleocarpae]
MVKRAVYVSLALLGAVRPCAAFEIESLDAIRNQVQAHLTQQYASDVDGPMIEAVKIQVSKLDPRLKLRRCDNSLTLETSDTGERGGNITVAAACDETWRIFVPARVDTLLRVAVANRSLARGELVQAGDISLSSRNTATLGAGYVGDPDRIVGKVLKRNLNQGGVFRISSLQAPRVIRKGDALRVEANSGRLRIVAPGIALADGQVGQQIRVKNTDSQRIIKARVVAAGRVEVVL